MTGDKLIFKPEHYKKANIILPKIVKVFFHTKFVVTIGGCSGTGKTEISFILQEQLWEQHKIRAKILHLDDYYKVLWLERNRIRKKKGMVSVGVKEINWSKIKKIIKDFKTNKKYLYTQKIHRYTNSIEENRNQTKYIDILIIDGLYANYLKEKDFGIYLEGTIKDTDKFRKERGKEIQNLFRYKVLRKESKEVQLTKKFADLDIPFKI